MFNFRNEKEDAELISAKSLMLSIGILAFIFPILLIINAAILEDCELIQNSISAYYHTVSRNLFVGSISAIAFCLFAYKGYCGLDNLLANLAAILALGVAFFPTSVAAPFTDCLRDAIDMKIIGTLHFIFAAGLFILLGCFSAFIFTKGSPDPTAAKVKRNRIYKICGYLIFLFILLITIYIIVIKKEYPSVSFYRPVYWLETFSLWAFGISWLTKSGLIWSDDANNA